MYLYSIAYITFTSSGDLTKRNLSPHLSYLPTGLAGPLISLALAIAQLATILYTRTCSLKQHACACIRIRTYSQARAHRELRVDRAIAF